MSDQQLIANHKTRRGGGCAIQVQVTQGTMTVSLLGDIICAEGGWGSDRPILEMLPRGTAPTSPSEGVLRHMRHQELWRAARTHYGPTRIYGPTGHAIGWTAQQALRSVYHSYHSQASALSVTTTGRQQPVGVWTSPQPQEPARLRLS